MNHETTIATLNAQLNNCAKDLYEKDKRIAELERENARLDAALDGEISCRDHYHEWADKLAAEISRYFGVDIGEHSNVNNPWERSYEAVPAAPAVEQQPLGWLRKWAFDGEKPRKEKGKWVAKFRFLPITQHQAFNDDVPLYAAPQAADTDKVREVLDKLHAEIMNLPANKSLHIYEDDIGQTLAYKTGHRDARHSAAELAASMAAQAPVREVPGWKLVPVEPTHNMYRAAAEADDNACVGGSQHGADVSTLWAVMVDAAPLPAAPVQQVGDRG